MGRSQLLGPAVIRDVLDLLALIIKARSCGSVARKVAPFAVYHHAADLVPELAYGVRAFGNPHVADLADERGGLVIQEGNVGVGRLAAVVKSKPAADAHRSRRRLVL